MALSDRLLALTLAIANAINTRAPKVGASVYDLAVINGFVGTQAQWLAQNPTGTVFATPAALNAAVGNYVEGAVVGLAPVTTANGKILGSTWRKQSSWWVPLEDLKCVNAATLTDIKGWTIAGGPYQGLSFDPRYTKAQVIRDGVNAKNGWDEWVWIGPTTGFYQWTGSLNGGAWASGTSEHGQTYLLADGETVKVGLHGITGTGPISQYGAVITLPPLSPPINSLQALAGGYGTWTTANFYVDANNKCISLLTGAIPANTEFMATGFYRRQIPTV